MRKYFNTVISTTTGKPISGAQVRVKDSAGDLATLYSDDGGTALSNPVTTDANGLYEFYAENGSYDFEFLFGGELVQTITDVEISEDVTALQLVAPTGAELVGVEDGRTLAAWLSGRTVDASKYGLSTSNTAAENVAAFDELLADLGGGDYPVTVIAAPGIYQLGQVGVSAGNIHLWAYGATFTGSAVQFSVSADEFKIFGARIVDTDSTGGNFGINFGGGDRNGLIDCTLVKTPEAGGYHAYVQLTSTNCIFDRVTLRGSNGVFVEGTGHRFTNIDAIARTGGGDDLFAIKARNQATGDIVISGVKAEGYSNIVAFGSEIGTLGAASSTRVGRVQNVSVTGVVAKNCSYLLFIKPGAIDAGTAYDWRDGLVDNIRIQGIITDSTGTRMVRPAVISASRGAMVSNVSVDVQASGRSYVSGGGEQRVGADVYIPDYSAATPPAAAPTIKDVFIKLRCFDPYNGKLGGVLKLNFTSGGTTEITAGTQIAGASSGATAIVGKVVVGTGSWAAGTAAGYILLVSQTGTFIAENLDLTSAEPDVLNVATVAGDSTAVATTDAEYVQGSPFQNIARVAKQSSTHGAMSRIRLDIEGDGCSEGGILVSDGLDSSVEIVRARIRNTSVAAGGQGAINSTSDIKLGDIECGTTGNNPVGSASISGVVYTAKEIPVPIGTYAAGTAADKTIWVAPRGCYVHSVLLVDSAGIALNATNYTTLSLVNQAAGSAFVAAGTNVFTFSADTAVAAHFNDCIISTSAFNIPKGTAIRFTKADTGTGAAVTDMVAVIRYVEHGA